MECTQFHALDGDTHVINTGEHDHLCINVVFFDEMEYLDAVDVRHLYIKQNEIKKEILNGIYCFNAVGRCDRRVSLRCEDRAQHLAETRFIVNDKDRSLCVMFSHG